MDAQILDPYGRPFNAGDNLENPNLSLTDPRTWDLILQGSTANSGAQVNAKTALGYPPLWRGISLISGDVARLPLVVYHRLEDNGKEPARQHPAFPLLRRRASPILKASAFKRVLTFHALLHGNGYAAILRDQRGIPRELLVLCPTDTCPAIVGGELWYLTKIGGDDVRLPARDVFHIKGLSHDGICGLNVIDVMREALGLGIAARDMGARHFGQGMLAAGILMIPGHFTDEKAKNTMAAWNKMATGLTKAHRVALLQDGAKYQQISTTPEQSQFLETRQFEVREVANILGCPPHKLGDSSRTSYNSLEAENQSYLDECLDAWLVEWEDEANEKLFLPIEQEAETYFAEFRRDALLRTDAKTRSEVYTAQSGIGALTINDILRKENLPTIGPLGDRRYRPANWVEITDAPASAPPAVQAAAQKTRLALWALLKDRVERLERIEREQLERAGRSANAGPALDAFYAQHADRMTDALRPVVRAIDAVAGRKGSRQRLAAAVEHYRAEAVSAAADLHNAAARIADRGAELRKTLFPPRKDATHAKAA